MQESKPIIRQAEALIPTPWGNYNLMIVDKNDMQFTVGLTGMPWLNKNKLYKFDYIVHGSRKDAPLDIEQ